MNERRIIKKILTNNNNNYKYVEDTDILVLFHHLNITNSRNDFNNMIEMINHSSIYESCHKLSLIKKDVYVCVDISKKLFYYYNNGIWLEDYGNINITRDIINYNDKCASSLYFRNFYINDMALHSYMHDFINKLGNYKTIRLGNKSFDIYTGELREGLAIDYCSINTNVSISNDYKDEVIKVLKDIFPNNNIYNYVLRFIGSLLIPGNNDKIFMIWNGIGNNGKSILARLIELTLGEYSVKLPTSLVTGKRSGSSSATPELAMLEKRLVAFLQEPSHNEKLNIGIVKELTGNDTIYIRGLYKEARNISVLAKMIYIVNNTNNISVLEEAIWNRIVVVPFDSNFTDNIIEKNDKLMDKSLGNRLRLYTGSFLSIIVDEARMYLKEGLIKCEEVELSTKTVRDDNNIIIKYLGIGNTHSYDGLKMFIKEYQPDHPLPSKAIFNKTLINYKF